jgi:hypothetical protein
VHPRAGAQLPDAGVGLVVQRQAARPRSSGKVGLSPRTEQAVVVEGLRRTQHDVAVDVVLKMFLRLVAHAHRAHAAVALGVARSIPAASVPARCRTAAAHAPPRPRTTLYSQLQVASIVPTSARLLSARTTKKASRSQQ